MVSTVSDKVRKAPSDASSSKARPSDQIGSFRELGVQPELARGDSLESGVQSEEERVRRAARIADRREQPISQEIQTCPAQEIAARRQLARQRRRETTTVPLESRQ